MKSFIDRLAVAWIMFSPEGVAKRLAEMNPNRTMKLGMAIVEAVMTNHPEAGVEAIKGSASTHWGVVDMGEKEKVVH